jgi:hypothetical protein
MTSALLRFRLDFGGIFTAAVGKSDDIDLSGPLDASPRVASIALLRAMLLERRVSYAVGEGGKTILHWVREYVVDSAADMMCAAWCVCCVCEHVCA